MYKTLWTPRINVVLSTELDRLKPHNKHYVSVKEGVIIVGHIPRELSNIGHHFIKCGGIVQVEVIDIAYRRSNIPEGGLEIPDFFLEGKETSDK